MPSIHVPGLPPRLSVVLVLLAVVAVPAPGVRAQAGDGCPTPAPGTTACRSGDFGRLDSGPNEGERAGPPGVPVLASLALPGAGQWLQGEERAWAYLGVEALGILGYLERSRAGRRFRSRYRDLAWRVARDRSHARVDGDFEYYEALARFPSSGAWDAAPGREGIQPETDPTTYNGRIWSLAREIYSLDPESPDPRAYRRALEYYRERSYRPEMAWDWSSAPAARDDYRDLIDESDARFREATIAVGLVLGNHLLSAVDAYVSGLVGTETARHLSLRPWRSPAGRPGWGLHLNLRP